MKSIDAYEQFLRVRRLEKLIDKERARLERILKELPPEEMKEYELNTKDVGEGSV